MTEQTATRFSGVANVAVPVDDHERALRFYRDTLGFEVRRDSTFGPGLRWVEVAPSGSQTTVALAPKPDPNAGGVDSGIRLATSDAAGAHEYLSAQGVAVDDLLRMPGVPPMFSLRDTEGNTLYVVETGAA